MKNSVTFYKVPWTNSSLNQPYFMTESDRDSYLQDNCYPFVVLQNVNINLLTDMNVELKVPIDITVAQEYNFCKIEYNEKKYFACIIDYSQISVNRTYIYAKRHILTEIVNYLSNFENFNISTATLNDSLIYKKNAKFYKPEFRSYKKAFNGKWKIAINTSGDSDVYVSLPTQETYDLTYENFLILFTTKNLQGEFPYNFYGKPVQYGVIFIPLRIFFESGVKYKYSTTQYNHDNGKTQIVTNDIDFEYIDYIQLIEILNQNSPYIVGYKFTRLPVGWYQYQQRYIMPFYSAPYLTSPSGGDATYLGFELTSTSFNFDDIIDFYYFCDYSFESEYGFIEIRCMQSDMSIELDKSDYTDNSNKGINIKVFPFLSDTDDEFFICLQPLGDDCINPKNSTDESIKTYLFRTSFDLGDNASFVLSSEANFDAQNRYYDAMTKSVRNQKIAGAWVQGVQNIAIGGVEIGMALAGGGATQGIRQAVIPSNNKQGYSKVTLHSEYSRGANTAGESLGIGNIIRGVGAIVDGYIDAHYYEQQREIFAKNERAKPDTLIGGGNSGTRLFDSVLGFIFIEEIPFENDYEIWQQNVERFGISCEIFSNEIDLNDYIKNNHFVIQAVAEMKSTALLNCVEYDALYEVLTGGCRYFIVGTVPSSNSNLLEEEVSNES